jgi:hypothetical protein
MKQVSIILCMLLMVLQQTNAQGSNKIESFNRDVLPLYQEYFSLAEQTENGQLKLTALENYLSLTLQGKKLVMDKLVKNWQETLVIIHYNTKSELWGWDFHTGNALPIDNWDLNAITYQKSTTEKLNRSNLHPWFFYVGGMTYFDSYKNADVALSTNVGFFLLLNRWDLALSFSEFIKGNSTNEESSTQASLGLMSRVYFPIKEYNLSPSIGVELDWSAIETSETDPVTKISPALLLGASWYVGIGSLDIGVKIGSGVTTMIGYTFIPQFSKDKKKLRK